MKLKYPIHFEVSKRGLFEIENLTSKHGFRPAVGMGARHPKRFRSYNSAKTAAKKHDATLVAFWLEEGEYEYNRLTLEGPHLQPNHIRYLPDIVKTWIK